MDQSRMLPQPSLFYFNPVSLLIVPSCRRFRLDANSLAWSLVSRLVKISPKTWMVVKISPKTWMVSPVLGRVVAAWSSTCSLQSGLSQVILVTGLWGRWWSCAVLVCCGTEWYLLVSTDTVCLFHRPDRFHVNFDVINLNSTTSWFTEDPVSGMFFFPDSPWFVCVWLVCVWCHQAQLHHPVSDTSFFPGFCHGYDLT